MLSFGGHKSVYAKFVLASRYILLTRRSPSPFLLAAARRSRTALVEALLAENDDSGMPGVIECFRLATDRKYTTVTMSEEAGAFDRVLAVSIADHTAYCDVDFASAWFRPETESLVRR